MSVADFDARSGGFLRAMQVAGESGMLTLVHCEDACIVSHVTERLVAEGRGDLSNYAEARPVYSERVAVVRAIGFAEAAGAPIYIVHLSSADALAEAHAAHARGLPVYVETRPMYLHLTSRAAEGAGRAAVRRPAAAARAARPGRALERAAGRRRAHLLHRPRGLDARAEARPVAERRQPQARHLGPRDADADAVRPRRADGADLARALRRGDRDQRGQAVRPVPAQGHDRRRRRRRPRRLGSRAAPHRAGRRLPEPLRVTRSTRAGRSPAGRPSPSAGAR